MSLRSSDPRAVASLSAGFQFDPFATDMHLGNGIWNNTVGATDAGDHTTGLTIYVDELATGETTRLTLSYPLTATAAVSYNILSSVNNPLGGTVTCSPDSVVAGESSACTVTTNPGFIFDGFTGDCSGTTCDLTNIDSDKNVIANFIASYTVTATAQPAAGGTVVCTPTAVAAGGSSSCIATSNTGYVFDGFTGDCSGSSCDITNINADQNIIANFERSTEKVPSLNLQTLIALMVLMMSFTIYSYRKNQHLK